MCFIDVLARPVYPQIRNDLQIAQVAKTTQLYCQSARFINTINVVFFSSN